MLIDWKSQLRKKFDWLVKSIENKIDWLRKTMDEESQLMKKVRMTDGQQ